MNNDRRPSHTRDIPGDAPRATPYSESAPRSRSRSENVAHECPSDTSRDARRESVRRNTRPRTAAEKAEERRRAGRPERTARHEFDERPSSSSSRRETRGSSLGGGRTSASSNRHDNRHEHRAGNRTRSLDHEGHPRLNARNAESGQSPRAHRQREIYAGGNPAYDAVAMVFDFVRQFAIPLAALLIVLLAIAGISFACSRTAQPEPGTNAATDLESEPGMQQVMEEASYELSPAAIENLSTDAELATFSLSNLPAGELSEEQTASITTAIEAVEESGDVGIMFFDVDTGRGISYNIDQEVYGASSFKAPYALFLCETFVETGELTLDSFAMGSPIGDLMSNAIIYSDNNSYGALRDTYDSLGFDEWVSALGADDAKYTADSWYPWYCARSSAEVWTEMLAYLETGSETSQWLGDLLASTEESFLRNGIANDSAVVRNKAGWCADSDPRWNSVSDAGIIELDGHTYIMSIMTGMPDSEASREAFEALASAVFAVRDTFAEQMVAIEAASPSDGAEEGQAANANNEEQDPQQDQMQVEMA